MNYNETLEYIHSLKQFGVKPSLERIGRLTAALGNPQDKLRCVHVAGTNGKGSTATMTANILRQAGYKTGLFFFGYCRTYLRKCGSCMESGHNMK